ncbi:MAG: YafY family protein [Bacillota bacterium]|nr:YafY family protein [Bacillota bacterium]
MKTDRMIYILLALLNKEHVTAAELAEHFKVSVRTIYRDIEALNMAGVPIYAKTGAEGGFTILENYRSDKQLISEEEVTSIITALKSNISQKEKIRTIKEALEENKILSFKYINYSNINSERIVEPINLIFKGFCWYLSAYCRKEEIISVFRLSKMEDLKTLNHNYELKEELLNKKEKKTFGMNKHAFSVNSFTMKFSARVRSKVLEYFDEEQLEYMDDGSMRVDIDYPEDDWTYGFILSFGADAEVLKPQRLRESIKEKSSKVYDLYK